MQNRTKLWIQYYNFKRPHQGIGGLCPADRFYEVSHDVRQVVESGIAANVLQMALMGVPRKPCYLGGRMDDQSVTVMAEKGCLKLQVTDIDTHKTQEMIYPLSTEPAKTDIIEGEIPYGKVERDDEKQAQHIVIAHSVGQMQSSAVGVDGEAQTLASLQGAGSEMDDPDALAESCHGRNAASAGAPQNLEKGAALSPRLQVMLAQREKNLLVRSALKPGNRLETRLANIAAKAEQKSLENTKTQQKE